ncbi:MAG: type II toxin-antitoxin system VapC family toxin [Thermoanaerobaculia bacterium]
MAWVIDTCVLLDVLEDDPEFGRASALALENLAEDGLTICPVTYAELAPAFEGNPSLQDEFLIGVGVDFRQGWLWEDTLHSHELWNDFVQRRRKGQVPKRPLADVLIGAFASRHQGLITRNQDDFATILPDLPIRVPSSTDD